MLCSETGLTSSNMRGVDFLFAPYHNTGCHFVHWSLCYLSGQQTYYAQQQTQTLTAPTEILNRNNAHQHRLDIVNGHQHAIEYVTNSASVGTPKHVYLTPKLVHIIEKEFYNVNLVGLNSTQLDVLYQAQISDCDQLLKFVQQCHRLIFLDYDLRDIHNIIYNDRRPMDFDHTLLDSVEQKWNRHKSQFFSELDSNFDSNNIWDQREKLALMIKNFQSTNFKNLVDKKLPHLYYTTDDVWNDLPNVIAEIIDFVGLELDQSHIDSWKPVYWIWREKHDNFFSRQLDNIVSAIVNNNYMRLDRFRLNLLQEAMIQHKLMSEYNLNLKTWNLSQFPNNTQELHLLLEPNIHQL